MVQVNTVLIVVVVVVVVVVVMAVIIVNVIIISELQLFRSLQYSLKLNASYLKIEKCYNLHYIITVQQLQQLQQLQQPQQLQLHAKKPQEH